MKKLIALVLSMALLSPAMAFAGSAATNAALGLGAFAVFNQILGGVGLFGGFAPPVHAYVAPAPAYVAPPPAPVYVAPAPIVYAPPPVVYATPPAVVYAPPRVVYAPAPAVVVPAPPVVVQRPVVVRVRHVRPVPVHGHAAVVYRQW
jgi:hypothetical protein